ncbi:hypothetical protein BN2364_4013 [Alloalcanivorax xenomutans]|nr:hypothetical protein BN2364_4013 [Alloalcanivorax xenomutans]
MLMEELRLMGARNIVLSTNVALRRDGLPYAGQKQPDDAGVAVYFEYKQRSMTFACDRWRKVEDNTQAIRKTIEALRGIERWGASDMMERAFTGFQALPSSASTNATAWWVVLEVDHNANPNDVRAAYQRRRKQTHPDHGGTADQFSAVQRAWEQYQEARNG